MSYKLKKCEMETIIRFDEDSKEAVVSTYNKRLINKLRNMSLETKEIIEVKYTIDYGEYRIPKKLVQVKKPRIISESDRLKMQQRARERFGTNKSV